MDFWMVAKVLIVEPNIWKKQYWKTIDKFWGQGVMWIDFLE